MSFPKYYPRRWNSPVAPASTVARSWSQAGGRFVSMARSIAPNGVSSRTSTSVTGLRHVVGTVSMARAPAADSARSDFFICLDDQPSLDSGGKRFEDAQGAAAFGRVIAGMDVVRKIQQQPVQKQALTPPIPITKATRVTPGR
jgi:cyclophilin family peptidyl-prolyl cis-trans isomerase